MTNIVTSLRIRRGTTTNLMSFTGKKDEIAVDTTKKVPLICSGETAGDHVWCAREDLNNVKLETILNKGVADSALSNVTDTSIKRRGIALADCSNISLTELYVKGVAQANANNIQKASTSKYGTTRFATAAEAINSDADDIAISPATLSIYSSSVTRTFSPMYISGFVPSWVDDSTIRISIGSCRTQDDYSNIVVNMPITLTLPTRTANTTYHAFIGSNNVGNTMAQFSTTLEPETLIANGYTHYRRLCSVDTDENTNIRRFMYVGNVMYYNMPIELDAPTDTYTKVESKTPDDLLCTPIYEVIPNTSYSIGIEGLDETAAIDMKSQGVVNCFMTTKYIMIKGSGTAQLIGYVDDRTFM